MTLFPPSSCLSSRALLLSTALVSNLLILTGCQSVATPINTNATTTSNPVSVSAPSKLTPAVQIAVGDYVTDGYAELLGGNDWVSVMVRPFGESAIDIKVRAIGESNQPHCRFDGRATLMGQDKAHGVIFQTTANHSVTFLQFKDGKLTIDSSDKTALHSFCTGSATLAGDYKKLASTFTFS